MARSGLEGAAPDLDPVAFVDRHGEAHVPFRAAQWLAQAFVVAEPKTVLLTIERSRTFSGTAANGTRTPSCRTGD